MLEKKMNIWVMFFSGILLGWLIEWIIDLVYWHQRYQLAESKQKQCKEHITALEIEVERLKKSQTSATAVEIPQVEIIPDDLKVIKGIGPVIQKKLNEAGIYTFEQLGAISVEKLRELLGDVIERLADEESLLEQARRLGNEKVKKGK